MRYAIISLAFTLVCAVEETPKPLPMEVLNVLATYEKSVVTIRKTYDIAELKVRGDAVAALQKAKTTYMQKGDLEGATLVVDAMKKLEAGETLGAIEENIKKAANLLGMNPQDTLIGKWNLESQVIEFKKDGTVIGSNPDRTGKWSAGKKTGDFNLEWAPDFIAQVSIIGDKLIYKSPAHTGWSPPFKKIK